jgi:hypothetical protein
MRKGMWEARVSDLEEGDVIVATCDRCRHQGYIRAEEIQKRVTKDRSKWRAIFDYTRLLDLKMHLRCARCPVPLNSRPHHDIVIRVENDLDRRGRR